MPSPDNESPKKKKADGKDSLKEKIRRHLNDKNDHITDEDLRDLIVGSDEDSPAAGDSPANRDNTKSKEDETPKDKPGTSGETPGDA
ncbi:MAG: hypothetical protein ABWZ25_05260 [Chitinophagaceae bacterium]